MYSQKLLSFLKLCLIITTFGIQEDVFFEIKTNIIIPSKVNCSLTLSFSQFMFHIEPK